MHRVPNETMKHNSVPLSSKNPATQDLLWISKEQQQHPSIYAHPLKNTIRVNSRGIRCKFDGKQWRTLCQSHDGYECRNIVFRSSLCQKHFYKIHHFKRPYTSTKFPAIPPILLKRSSLSEHQEKDETNDESEDIYEDDDSIEVIENNDAIVSKQEPEFSYFSIDCEPESIADVPVRNKVKSEPSSTTYASRTEGLAKRLDSTNNESLTSNESEASSLNISIPKITESLRLGIPPLTRTEEKSLANELITQLPTDVSFIIAEQMTRRRVCEIVYDNYSHKISSGNISTEWFYDFLLRNPRIPIHFQSWFSSFKSTLPSSDQLIDIKIWELGLVTRSSIPSYSNSIASSSLFSP